MENDTSEEKPSDEKIRQEAAKFLAMVSPIIAGVLGEAKGKLRAEGALLVPYLLVNLIQAYRRTIQRALADITTEQDFESFQAGTTPEALRAAADRETLKAALETFELVLQPWAEEWLGSWLKLAGARDEAGAAALFERLADLIRRARLNEMD